MNPRTMRAIGPVFVLAASAFASCLLPAYEVQPGGAGGAATDASGGGGIPPQTVGSGAGGGGSEATSGSGGAGAGAGGGGDCPSMGATTTLACGLDAPSGIVHDATHLYWTREGGGPVLRAPKTGGAPEVVTSAGDTACALAMDAFNGMLYVRTVAGSISRIRVSDTFAQPLTSGEGPVCLISLDATGAELSWTRGPQTSTKIMKSGLSPFAPVELTTSSFLVGLNAKHPANVYFGSAGTSLYYADKPTGMVTFVSSLSAGSSIDLDATYLFWTDGDLVRRATLPGASPTTLASGESNPVALATDANAVYWVSRGSGEVRSIEVAPPVATPPTVIATGQDQPCSITLDVDELFWTTCGGGTVVRAQKNVSIGHHAGGEARK
jgi:hypothetical protein